MTFKKIKTIFNISNITFLNDRKYDLSLIINLKKYYPSFKEL